MEFNPELLGKLADGLGEIARGCKKLRSFVLALKETAEPQETVSVSSTAATVGGRCILDSDFDEAGRSYFRGRPFIGQQTHIKFLDFVLKDSVRADRFRNYWVLRPETRKKWHKISEQRANELMRRVKVAWEMFQDNFRSPQCPDHIRPTKWGRRKTVLEIELDDVTFRKYLRQKHNDMPSLR